MSASFRQYSIFVSRLPEVDNIEDCLRTLFSTDGRINQVRVLVSKHNASNKFAFVNFADDAAAEKALGRNNQAFMGKTLNVGAINDPFMIVV
jgi:RNA recognition motif-containing protein